MKVQKVKSLILILIFVSQISSAQPNKVILSEDIILEAITENIWIHISYIDYPGYGRISANGLLVKENDQVVIIDTPWTNELTEVLYRWVQNNWYMTIQTVVVTHYHDDNLGGLEYLHSQGVNSYAYAKTKQICKERKLPIPRNTFLNELVLDFSPLKIKIYFPGQGHTIDNICVYIPAAQVLFGGCAVKSLASNSLGDITEANLKAWPDTLKNMKQKYSTAKVVVPGHGQAGDLSLIDHTLTLFK